MNGLIAEALALAEKISAYKAADPGSEAWLAVAAGAARHAAVTLESRMVALAKAASAKTEAPANGPAPQNTIPMPGPAKEATAPAPVAETEIPAPATE